MDTSAALRAFARVVERGSLTAAARDLGISQPAVTKHVRNLENHVGARLLERTSRVVRTTPQGQALYDASRPALAAIDAALEGVGRDMEEVGGTLKVHAPSCIGPKHIHAMLMDFQEHHPQVDIDLVLDHRDVDIIYENFDLAIRYGRPGGDGLIIRRLGSVRRILVAAPEYLAKFGKIETLEDLSRARLVATPSLVGPHDTLQLIRGNEGLSVSVRPILRTNNTEVAINTLLSGRAAGHAQTALITHELAEGRLVRILPDYEVKPTEAFLVYPSIRYMRPVVRAFSDFVITAMRDVPGIDSGSAQA